MGTHCEVVLKSHIRAVKSAQYHANHRAHQYSVSNNRRSHRIAHCKTLLESHNHTQYHANHHANQYSSSANRRSHFLGTY